MKTSSGKQLGGSDVHSSVPSCLRAFVPSLGYVVFFLSGVAGLGYEIVWTRMFAIGLGHEMHSLLAVVAAFFGGVALGAWGLDGAVSRSARPGRWYVWLEAIIGLWALASIALIPVLNTAAAKLAGVDPSPARQWLVAFGIPFVGLLPATAAMGATFPAMERMCSRLAASGRIAPGLYAVNTAGAVAGTLAATWIIIPGLGYTMTLAVLAVVNGACAAAVAVGPAQGEARRAPVEHRFDDRPGDVLIGVTVLCTGLLGIGYEVLCVRVMGQVLENTVYSFASALSMFLVGTAIGAALYQRFLGRASFGVPLAVLLQCTSLACLLGVAALSASSAVYEWVRLRLGAGPAASVAAEMALAALVFLAPTILMGATFGHLALAARGARGGVGRALGLNTIGSALAPPVFGVALLPWVGAKWALCIAALAYLLPVFLIAGLRARHLVPSLLVVPVFMLLPGRLVLVETPPGMRIAAYRDGVMASVAVLEDGAGERVLKVNNRFQMGGTIRSFADRRQAYIPLLLHPDPRRALFLGLGTGITAGASTDQPGLEVRGVELLPEVVELLPMFAPANHLDRLNAGAYVVGDARRYVRASTETFDVIVADLFHPARDGAGALYTRRHFEAIRQRLAPGGLFCQWLPLYQLDDDMVRLIVRTFLSVFPDATAWLAHFNAETPMLGLVGTLGGIGYGPDWYEKRVTDPQLSAAVQDVALGNGLTLMGALVAGTQDLRRYAGDGPINTDDRPLVVFGAPQFTYGAGATGYGRLEALLAESSPSAADLLESPDDPAARRFAQRLDRYLEARDLYLAASILLAQGRGREAIDTMLQSARTTPDFVTAYVHSLQLALDAFDRDPSTTLRILEALVEVNPDDPRAAEYIHEFFD